MKVIKHKNKLHFLATTLFVSGTLLYFIPPHFGNSYAADCTGVDTSKFNCSTTTTNTASGDTQFAVEVQEALAMTIESPKTDADWAKDDVEKFLRNEVKVQVASNNPKGFTTGMSGTTSTNLTHTSDGTVIPTLSATNVTRSDEVFAEFPTNAWGFSLNDATYTGKYNPIAAPTAAPSTILSSPSNDTKTTSVYFGAKADETISAGTYVGNVKFTTVAGNNGADLTAPNNPSSNPNNPAGPSADTPMNSPSSTASVSQVDTGTYSYTTGTRTYSTGSTRQVAMAGTGGSTEEVAITADNTTTKDTDTKDSYLAPLGVVDRTTSTVQNVSPVTHVLMTVASVTAVVGLSFFAVAKFHDHNDR